jgi:tRNA (cytidine/uridine-2'-O-)-methyltransferase
MDRPQERQATFGRNGEPGAAGPGLAVWQPDRPHNLGALVRLCACWGVPLDVVEPAAFALDDRRIREAALDYGRHARWRRFVNGDSFVTTRRGQGRRLVLLSTTGPVPYHHAVYGENDVLILGNERDGVPEWVHATADLRVRIPLLAGRRALNVAMAAAVVLAEALRQLGRLDELAGVGALR